MPRARILKFSISPDRFGIDEPQTGYGTVTRMAATESILQALPA